jgi:[ribosomal protein S18]-alanine N-acetyltransferase
VTGAPRFVTAAAEGDDPEWAARLMAASDPWITLGRGLEACLAACRRPEIVLLVARDGEQRCGFALVHPRGLAGSPYLAAIAADPSWRGRGVGAALLDRCERLAADTSPHFFLCVSSFNTRAQAFYTRQGYTQVGRFDDYIIDGASELLMYKRVAAPRSSSAGTSWDGRSS